MTTISKTPINRSVVSAKAYDIYGDNITGMSGVVIGTGEMGRLQLRTSSGKGVMWSFWVEILKKIEEQLGRLS